MPRGNQSVERIAEHAGRITTWYACLAERQAYYPPAELERALGTSMRALAGPLELFGWYRARVWSRRNNKRMLLVYWIPPNGRAPRPPRGRPRFDLLASIAV